VALPADDDDELAPLVAVALGDDDALFLGVAEDVPEADEEAEEEADEEEEEDAGAAGCVAVGLVQLACGLGSTGPLGGTVPLGLLLGLVVADGVPVVVGLGLLLGLAVADGVPVVVEVGLGPLLAPALELAVLPLLWLPPDDVAGAVVAWVAVLGELLVLCVADGLAEDDPQAVVREGAKPGMLAPPGVGAGALLWTSVPPAPLAGLLLLVKAWLTALKPCTIAWRAGGTTDRTTPMANTATPTPRAGRSIASRQSMGRRGRCGARFACSSPWAGTVRRTRSPRRREKPATKPEMTSQMPSTPAGRLAWDGRDRILSRIRCRPSAPGSTWSAAECSSRRKNSAKSCPCLPSKPWPRLTMNPAPAPRAARPCPARCGS
jgi:hypothetical protein